MGLFGKKKKEDASENKDGALLAGSSGATVEPINKNSEELQNLLEEFREMRAGVKTQDVDEEEVEEVQDDYDGGEEYEVSETESESIEDFLSSGDEEEVYEEEPIDEEFVDEPVEEEVVEEEPIEEEVVEEEPVEEDVVEEGDEEPEEAVNVEVGITIPEDEKIEEEVDYEEDSEIDETTSEEEENPNQKSAPREDFVTSDDIDKKFDDFEKRLLEKLLMQFSAMQQPMAQAASPVAAAPKKAEQSIDEDELDVKTIGGKLTINGFTFNGEVVMFTPIDSLKKASWEEVVRRKGHCTYHLTTSGNGGWFIKKSNAPNPYAYIERKDEAEELAKFYAKREKAELKIHNNKGVIEKSLSFGREKLRG